VPVLVLFEDELDEESESESDEPQALSNKQKPAKERSLFITFLVVLYVLSHSIFVIEQLIRMHYIYIVSFV